jgi:hypothetical protein
MDDVPVRPPQAALIVAVPAAAPVTRPLELTAATEVLLLDQVKGEQLTAAPLASRALAVSCCVPPTAMLAEAGVTVTDATVEDVAGVVAAATFDTAPYTAP